MITTNSYLSLTSPVPFSQCSSTISCSSCPIAGARNTEDGLCTGVGAAPVFTVLRAAGTAAVPLVEPCELRELLRLRGVVFDPAPAPAPAVAGAFTFTLRAGLDDFTPAGSAEPRAPEMDRPLLKLGAPGVICTFASSVMSGSNQGSIDTISREAYQSIPLHPVTTCWP